MAINAKFKFDGTQYDFEKDASAVTYGEGKLNTALNGLQEVRTTGFGRQLLSADEEDFRRLLEISKEDIWDEGQNRWSNNAYRSSKKKKFDNYSLDVGKNSLYTDVVFGKEPFTISFYMYVNSYTVGDNFRAIGSSYSFGIGRRNVGADVFSTSEDWKYHLFYLSGATSLNTPTNTGTTWTSKTLNSWTFIKLYYDGSGTLKVYQDGTLQKTVSRTIPREVRRIYLGSFNGYIDSFKLVDNGETISLLNFE